MVNPRDIAGNGEEEEIWLACQAPGIIWSLVGLVGLVSVYIV